MTRSELVALVQQRCGNRDDLETRILAELGFVQKTVLEGTGAFKPWFLQSDPTDLVTVAGEAKVNYPADYLGELEDNMLWYLDSGGTWQKLNKKSYDYILEKNLDPGVPKYFVVGASNFYIGPTPDAVYTLRFRYIARDTEVAAGGDTNLWLTYAPDLVMAEIGLRICKYHTRDAVAAEEFKQDVMEARQRLFVDHEARQNVNRVYGMGED